MRSISFVSFGKDGGFISNLLFGHPFGWTYEIANEALNVVQHREIKELGRYSLLPLTNLLITFQKTRVEQTN